MPCPHCGSDAVSPLGRCTNCGRDAAASAAGEAATSVSTAGPVAAAGVATGPLVPGQPFGSRYHIIRVLGAGGMGVVYHAWDGELGVAVALKVIRPEVLYDSEAAEEVHRRFKRELVLARQVTHRNVVRIHDLGEVSGIKYLTMPFVQGDNLAAVLKAEGKLPLPRALSIARQVAAGLAAAHEVGVVHRDLKPENIMITGDGDALIMDFGISRSVSGTGTATQLGAVLGTLEYMAPEQAQAQPVDHRADIYSFGLVLYDLIAGRRRLVGRDNPMSEVLSRMQAAPTPIRALDPSVPEPVERILNRCLASSPDARYATTAELVADLEALTPDGHLRQPAAVIPGATGLPWTTLVLGVTVLLLLAAGAWWMVAKSGPSAPPAPVEPVSVLVANFENRTSDEQFDGLLEQALAIGIEGASFLTAYPRRDALRVAQQIDPGRQLNEDLAMLVSKREGIDVIVAGAITHDGGKYTLSVKVLDLSRSTPLLEWSTDVAQKDAVLAAVGQGAAQVRSALGDTTADTERPKDAETFTAASLDAAAAYARAQELTWAGEIDAAIAQYQEAIRLDSEFGRAYSGLAALYSNTNRRDEAVKYYQVAMSHTDRMTEREKFRTRGGYYLLVRNSAKATEEFEQLVQKYPADTAGLANLAVARVYDRKMSEALDLGRRAAKIYPDNIIRRNNVALFAMYAGDFETAEREALEVISINAEFPKAYVALALAQLAQGRAGEAEATWRRLQRVPAGRSFAIAGLADLAVTRGRLAEAAGILAAESPQAEDPRRLVTLAEVRLAEGNAQEAASLAARAAALAKGNPPVMLLAGEVLASGRQREAVALADGLQAEIDREPQIYGALLAGEIALTRGDARAALNEFNEAQARTDTWLGRFGLGRAYLAAGKYPEAESEFDRCLARRGEATAVFLDEIPTYRLVPPVHYYLGLAREGLKNDRGAAEAFKTFLDLKKDGDAQGLVADARRRLADR